MEPSENPYGSYLPSRVAAIAGAAVFLLITLAEIWQVFRTRKWFGLPIVIGGIFECVGLAARAYSSNHLTETTPFIMQVLLVLLAPILYSASVYMFLGRLIRAAGHPHLSFIRVSWLSKIFVFGDIFCFLVQALGAAKIVDTKHPDGISTGKNIILAGLGFQLVIFFIFFLCAAVFHARAASNRYAAAIKLQLPNLTTMLLSLYFCSLLITVRNIYRLIEYTEGTTGYLQSREWPTYALDVVLMAILMVVTFTWYSINAGKKDVNEYMLTPRD